ncbi:MAG: galactitol-1-phosphate 5-dehydrogenase [Clostridiales bacterium]|jgi:L-iditol 2-dehydrogenase|nr:galactitol-1-phosphate 5-dehydrogenase [Clostridiales bacterium]
MSEKMIALVMVEYNHFEIQRIDIPIPDADEVLVKVKACAICGSDIHGMDGGTGRRIPPIVMGHEASGIIVKTGEAVKSYKEGQRVTFDSTVYCNKCKYCESGDVNLCDDRRVLGVSCGDYRMNGAFAEYVAVKEYTIYPLPENVSYEQAALVEPLSVAIHAIHRIVLNQDDSVAVIGAGSIGLMVISALKAMGLQTVISSDIDDNRLHRAMNFGATAVINTSRRDGLTEVLSLTNGKGTDASFEAVGLQDTVDLSVNCLRKGGKTVWIGNLAKTVQVPLQEIVTRQLSLFGTCACAGEYVESLKLISEGKVDAGALLSLKAPLENGGEIFHRLRSGKENLMKVILTP